MNKKPNTPKKKKHNKKMAAFWIGKGTVLNFRAFCRERNLVQSGVVEQLLRDHMVATLNDEIADAAAKQSVSRLMVRDAKGREILDPARLDGLDYTESRKMVEVRMEPKEARDGGTEL